MAEGVEGMAAGLEVLEDRLGPVEQPCFEEVLPQLIEGLLPLALVEVAAIDQVLVMRMARSSSPRRRNSAPRA
jgi:hypothetical protein